jgi:hypothetical protein
MMLVPGNGVVTMSPTEAGGLAAAVAARAAGMTTLAMIMRIRILPVNAC